MASSSTSCPSCGARVPHDADRCDLCGVSINTSSASEEPAPDGSSVQSEPSQEKDPQQPSSQSEPEASSDAEEGASSPERAAEGVSAGGKGPSEGADSVYCNECGWKNPSAANFCSRCGEKLQTLDTGSTPTPPGTKRVGADLPSSVDRDAEDPAVDEAGADDEADESSVMTQQVVTIVGSAVLVVVALFFVSLWSQNQSWSDGSGNDTSAQTESPEAGSSAAGAAQGGGAPGGGAFGGASQADVTTIVDQEGVDLPDAIAEEADSLETLAANAESTTRRGYREQLVNLYVGASAYGRAAIVQREMARSSDAVSDWRRTGDLFYSWMERVGQESGGRSPAIISIGREAVSAYRTVLERDPDNLDVRTDMATALLRSNDPMEGVNQINQVLEQDSTFVPARFNKGIALLWIGRFDQAIEQFELVQKIAGEGSPQYNQAEQAIQLIREEMESSSGSPSAQGNPPITPSP